MRTLHDADLLILWESGSRRHPLDQALLLLGAALPEESYESLADWTLGRRNRALADLRAARFGPSLEAWTACPHCAEKLEFQLDSRLLLAEEPESGHTVEDPIVHGGRTFRLPTSRDLSYAAREADPRAASTLLAERCLVGTAAPDGVEPCAWSDEDLEEIGERMAHADPLAETRLSLHCPECAYEWEELLDIVAFLWAEIDAQARRLLRTVHILASAYGWTESEILSLSERRRALYMDMVDI